MWIAHMPLTTVTTRYKDIFTVERNNDEWDGQAMSIKLFNKRHETKSGLSYRQHDISLGEASDQFKPMGYSNSQTKKIENGKRDIIRMA